MGGEEGSVEAPAEFGLTTQHLRGSGLGGRGANNPPAVGKMKFTKGNIDLGHFGTRTFGLLGPRPPSLSKTPCTCHVYTRPSAGRVTNMKCATSGACNVPQRPCGKGMCLTALVSLAQPPWWPGLCWSAPPPPKPPSHFHFHFYFTHSIAQFATDLLFLRYRY